MKNKTFALSLACFIEEKIIELESEVQYLKEQRDKFMLVYEE